MIEAQSLTLWAPFSGEPLIDLGENCSCSYLANLPVALSVAGVQDPHAVRLWDERLFEPADWNQSREVAVGAFADPFHPDIPWTFLARAFAVMLRYPEHNFYLVTLRPGTAKRFWRAVAGRAPAMEIPEHIRIGVLTNGSPLDQERVRAIQHIPARTKFLVATTRKFVHNLEAQLA